MDGDRIDLYQLLARPVATEEPLPPGKLFVLAARCTVALEVAVELQLMPGWTCLHASEQIRGQRNPYVLAIPGWEKRSDGHELAGVLAGRNAVFVDPDGDDVLDLWRSPDARRGPGTRQPVRGNTWTIVLKAPYFEVMHDHEHQSWVAVERDGRELVFGPAPRWRLRWTITETKLRFDTEAVATASGQS